MFTEAFIAEYRATLELLGYGFPFWLEAMHEAFCQDVVHHVAVFVRFSHSRMLPRILKVELEACCLDWRKHALQIKLRRAVIRGRKVSWFIRDYLGIIQTLRPGSFGKSRSPGWTL